MAPVGSTAAASGWQTIEALPTIGTQRGLPASCAGVGNSQSSLGHDRGVSTVPSITKLESSQLVGRRAGLGRGIGGLQLAARPAPPRDEHCQRALKVLCVPTPTAAPTAATTTTSAASFAIEP
jgi:hypothetical protein